MTYSAISQHVAALSGALPAIPSQPTAADKSRAVARPSVDHIMDAPLDELLAEFDIELTIVAIDEPEFTGIAYIKRGQIKYVLPAGRPDAEREIVVRAMLGQTLHVELPDLPDPYKLSEFDENGEPQQVNPRPVGGAV
ncbi:hypothetical protein ACGFNV_22215 [Streptomyces sp. NPDC048751]|uniref:hypothetical protein n=1 Tax=Streptomyces sp. NPDC048751 TaxID=3365591 RepID=UPI00371189B8